MQQKEPPMRLSQAGDLSEPESVRNGTGSQTNPVSTMAGEWRRNQVALANAVAAASGFFRGTGPHGRQAKSLFNSLVHQQRNEARPDAGHALS
jgi:hypothetical protein